MATPQTEFSDTADVRLAFLRAVAGSRLPIRAADLHVPGLDRRALQKRLERLRARAGGANVDDAAVQGLARQLIVQASSPVARGLARLSELGDPRANAFAKEAGLQSLVIDDWVELCHSPGDRGWMRDQIDVRALARTTTFARGRVQSWMTEKRRWLAERWQVARADPSIRRELTGNGLKTDLLGFRALGTEDAPACIIETAPVDWQTSLALNARLDERLAEGSIRKRWGEPRRIAERRGLPGMIVAHIVVETSDRKILVCRRQTEGIHDEPGTWSISLEERWDGHRDACPHDVVRRGIQEELGLDVADDEIAVLAWGLETDVLYPGFIALATAHVASWEVERIRAHAGDANELRFVAAIPADMTSVPLLLSQTYQPEDHPELEARWHRTAKARLFGALSDVAARNGGRGREAVLEALGAAL